MEKKLTIGAFIADTLFYSLAENAIHHAVNALDFNDVIVFTDNPLLGKGHTQYFIEKIKCAESYNKLILEELPQIAKSDYYLIIQYDGFPLDKNYFKNIFYNYDYIGAVWPQFNSHKVGNGGFSLRSLKLIQTVADLAYLRPPGEAEDVFICRTIRDKLESDYGIRFAPENLALQFSHEALGQSTNTFGFHGFFNLPRVYSKNPSYLLSNIPDEVILKRLPDLIHGSLFLEAKDKLHFDIELAKRCSILSS